MAKRPAGANSRRQYERGARQMIDASARIIGVSWSAASPAEKIDGLLAYLGNDSIKDILCQGTVGHYVQCAEVAIKSVLGDRDTNAVAEAVMVARGVLTARSGIPETLRGASLKLKDPSVEELGDVFSHLRWKFIGSGDRLDLLLALYIIVMPRIGLRPVEITWTNWDGNGLYTYTAKRAGRPKRYIPTEHWPPVYKAALGLFVKLVPRELGDVEFEGWRNVLASRLARASQWSRTTDRLSLYFARHIAIANWKQAGITPQVIADLAGHAGLKSQNSYASGRSGYGERYVFLDNDQAQSFLRTASNPDIGQDNGTEQKTALLGERSPIHRSISIWSLRKTTKPNCILNSSLRST